MAKKKTTAAARHKKRVSNWEYKIQKLHREADRLAKKNQELKRASQEIIDNSFALKAWSESVFDVSMTFSGEPGIIQATGSLRTPTTVFSKTKHFYVINLTHSLKFMAPETLGVWRQHLTVALDVIDDALKV